MLSDRLQLRYNIRLFGLMQLTTFWSLLITSALLILGLAVKDLMTLERSRPMDQGEFLDARRTLQTSIAAVRKQNRLLQRKLNAMVPSNPYIVIDAIGNRLLLKEGEGVIRETICSTGSRIELKLVGPKERRWFFDTPRGVFKVLSRHDNPIWIKPDWAFVEEGKPIPPARSKERLEEGVLGAHSLNFGNGYMIHGTLYTIKLGQPVTHGCIRLGDEDLELVYGATNVGTPIYIY
ncbi:MAG: L,D-transpeptidase [Candidatus Latescibacteria bacterium]|nr:L,D-transpeptidase [Candidatus Latescibacterota bacterium]